MKKNIGILIDSSSTFDLDFLKKHDIHFAPLSIVDNNNKIYKDGEDITPEKIVELLNQGYSFKTSMTPVGQLMQIVDKMFETYENVLFIPISKGLSGQWQAAQMLKDEFKNFYIVESTSAAYANENLLYEIIDMINENKPINEILNSCANVYARTYSTFSIENAKHLLHGGRTSSLIVHAINSLKLFPVIRLDVKNNFDGICRSYKTGIKKMIKKASKWVKNNSLVKKICIYFSNYNDEKLSFIKKSLSEGFNYDSNEIVVRWIPGCVLCHVAQGAYGFCLVAKNS